MAGFNELLQILVPGGIGFHVVPGGNVEHAGTGLAPAFGQVIDVGANAVGGIEEGPEIGGRKAEVEA